MDVLTPSSGPGEDGRVETSGQAWTQPTFWIWFLLIGSPFTFLSLASLWKAKTTAHFLAALAYFVFAGSVPVAWGLIFLAVGWYRKKREGRSVLIYHAPEWGHLVEFAEGVARFTCDPGGSPGRETTVLTFDFSLPSEIEEIPPTHAFRMQVKARTRPFYFDATYDLLTRDQAQRQRKDHGF